MHWGALLLTTLPPGFIATWPRFYTFPSTLGPLLPLSFHTGLHTMVQVQVSLLSTTQTVSVYLDFILQHHFVEKSLSDGPRNLNLNQ